MTDTGKTIHPAVGFVAIAWVMVTLYVNFLVSGFLLSMILVAYLVSSLQLEQIRKLAMLYLWITIPPYVVLAALYGPVEALDVVLRLLTIALAFTSVLQLMKPTELTYVMAELGVPALATLTIPMIMKLADYMNYSIGETLAALRGKGLRGRKLLTNLPIPLVVHVMTSSAQLAESISQKQFKCLKWFASKPAVKWVDVAIITYIAVSVTVLLLRMF